MTAVRGHAEVAADLRLKSIKSILDQAGSVALKQFVEDAAVLLAAVAAALPDCPRCGGTGNVAQRYRRRCGVVYATTVEGCPDCSDGKVTVAQLAALWEAVHDDDGRDVLSHFSGEYTIDHLRAVRP